MRFLVTHPPDPRPALIVETVPRIDDEVIARLKDALFRSGCPSGLVFDEDDCVILHDTYVSMDAKSFVEEARVATAAVLARVVDGRPLEQRVADWLSSMAASWNEALPQERAVAAPFITDIVPAVSGSQIRQVA